MIRRALFAMWALWAAAILANGMTRLTGIQEIDWSMAFAPLIAWFVLRRMLGFIASGR